MNKISTTVSNNPPPLLPLGHLEQSYLILRPFGPVREVLLEISGVQEKTLKTLKTTTSRLFSNSPEL